MNSKNKIAIKSLAKRIGKSEQVKEIKEPQIKEKKSEEIKLLRQRAYVYLLNGMSTEEVQDFLYYKCDREGIDITFADNILKDIISNKLLIEKPYIFIKSSINRYGKIVGEGIVDTSRLGEFIVDKFNIKMIADEETKSLQGYFYRNGVYKPLINTSSLAYREIRGTVVNAHEKAERAEKAIRTIIKDSQTYTIETSKQDTELINFKNGLYDWKKNSFKRHTSEIFSLIQIPHNYEPNGDTKINEWMNFLAIACKHKEENIRIIQEMIGYLLIPENKGKKIYVFAGPKDTGKTVLIELLEHIIGIKNISKLTPENIEYDKFARVRLNNKLANLAGDVKDTNLGSAAMLKELSGGASSIESERKGKDKQLINVYAKFVIACNIIPKSLESDNSFANRLLILEFLNIVDEKDKDPLLLLKLKEETNGIIHWAMEGLRRFIENQRNHSYSNHVERANDAYKERNDNVVYFFNKTFIKAGDREYSHYMTTTNLFTLYLNFCELDKIKPVSKEIFREILKNKIDYISYIAKSNRIVKKHNAAKYERKQVADCFYGFIDEEHAQDYIKLNNKS
jgi:P4 family phage/plasmid primase-like protien